MEVALKGNQNAIPDPAQILNISFLVELSSLAGWTPSEIKIYGNWLEIAGKSR